MERKGKLIQSFFYFEKTFGEGDVETKIVS